MNEAECLSKMVPPSQPRPDRWMGGVLQIQITRACDQSCFHCTQGSNLAGKPVMMTPEQFEHACDSLEGYPHVVGIFGGNPAMHPQFDEICRIFRSKFPFEQRGLWCNNPLGKGAICAETFNPRHSNLNVHLDDSAYKDFYDTWPASRPYLKGLQENSRHGSPFVSRSDIGLSEEEINEGTATCEVNQFWSALIGVVKGETKGFVCELMYTFAVLHEKDPDWPDIGMAIEPGWWRRPMVDFADQVRATCKHCGMPNKSYGQLAIGGDHEDVSKTHQPWFRPKTKDRLVQLVTHRDQIKEGALKSAITYIENGSLPVLQ